MVLQPVLVGAAVGLLVALLTFVFTLYCYGGQRSSTEDPQTQGGAAGESAAPGYQTEMIDLLWLTWPLMLGNTVEWYEYGIYGYTEAQIEANFVRGSSLATWMGYSITFVARPFGGFALGWVADNMGRTLSVQISLIGMLVATVGQGCLPAHYWGSDFETFGFVVLLIFQVLQGLSTGGEIGAISSYIVETASLRTLGFATRLISLGGTLAFGLAATVVGALSRNLSEEDMLVWGWRVPFLISAIPGLIALIGRNNIPDTEAFLEEASHHTEGAEEQSSAMELLTCRWRELLIGFGATVGIGTMWYVGPIWTVSGLSTPTLGPATALCIASASQLWCLVCTPFVGWLTDVKGAGYVMLLGSSVIALCSFPVWTLVARNPQDPIVAWIGMALVFGAIQALAGSAIYLFVPELFPTRIRTIALGMSYNLGVSYFGGLGPVICEILLLGVSRLYGPGAWMSFEESGVLKERRKAREERDLHQKKSGGNGGGGGGKP